MQDAKTGGSRWVPDIREDEITEFQEQNSDETATYKAVNVHPIISRVLDKLAFFRTHVSAVWYNKLANKTVKDKLDEIDTSISSLNSSYVSVLNNLQNSWEANGECGYVKMGNALFLQVSVRRGITTVGTVIATGFPTGYSAVIPNPSAGSSLGAVRLMNGQLDILLELENSDYLFINGVALKQS